MREIWSCLLNYAVDNKVTEKQENKVWIWSISLVFFIFLQILK